MLLLYDKTFKTSEEALNYFAVKRVGANNHEFKGAETPSQLRFVKYFDELLHKYNGNLPEDTTLELVKIKFYSINGNNFESLISTLGFKIIVFL